MTQISKKDKILLVILAVVFVITVFFLLRQRQGDDQVGTTEFDNIFQQDKNSTSSPQQKMLLPSIDVLPVDLQQDKRFQELKNFAPPSSNPIPRGRDNPFQPFIY